MNLDLTCKIELAKREADWKTLSSRQKNLEGTLEKATEEIKVWGVMELGDNGVEYRISVKTEPSEHFEIQRIMRKEIKNEFAKRKIKIPYQQIVVHEEK